MIIRCERCSTSFQLDDALVPPGGASVQCSRCQHEFWAARAGEERRIVLTCPRCSTRFVLPALALSAAGSDVQCSRCREVFRAPPPRPVTPPPFAPNPPNMAPGPLPRRNVMLFGPSGPLPDPTQPPAESYRSAEGRVVFGTPAPPPSNAPGDRMMMFGAPPPPSNAPGNRVMIFGAGPSVAPATPAAPAAPAAPARAPIGPEPRPPTNAERILDRVAGDLADEQALRVASDALMELDDPRGRLIAFMLDEERQSDLMRKVKVNVLIRDHAAQWAPPGARLTSFRRGLPVELEWTAASDPQHHVWRSARTINATLERVPRPSVLDVARPHLTHFTCRSSAVFAHLVAAAPKNLEVLDGHLERDQVLMGFEPGQNLVNALAKMPKLRVVTLRTTPQQFDAGLTAAHLRGFLEAARHLPALKRVRFSMPRLPPAALASCLAVAPALTVQFVIPRAATQDPSSSLAVDTQRLQLLVPEGFISPEVYALRIELEAMLGDALSIVPGKP